MTKDEALKLALEALEDAGKDDFWRYQDKAITAIKEALAQPEQEPVVRYCPECGFIGDVPTTARDCCPDGMHARVVPQRFAELCRETFMRAIEKPPQRKPLTDEEIILIVADCATSHQHTDIHFARAIEAAVWEKQK